MRFIAVIADNWEQFTVKLANHGWYFNVRLGTATREGKPRECAVFIDAHDQAFTREKTQGTVYHRFRVLSKSADRDVVDCVRSRTHAPRTVMNRMERVA